MPKDDGGQRDVPWSRRKSLDAFAGAAGSHAVHLDNLTCPSPEKKPLFDRYDVELQTTLYMYGMYACTYSYIFIAKYNYSIQEY